MTRLWDWILNFHKGRNLGTSIQWFPGLHMDPSGEFLKGFVFLNFSLPRESSMFLPRDPNNFAKDSLLCLSRLSCRIVLTWRGSSPCWTSRHSCLWSLMRSILERSQGSQRRLFPRWLRSILCIMGVLILGIIFPSWSGLICNNMRGKW